LAKLRHTMTIFGI